MQRWALASVLILTMIGCPKTEVAPSDGGDVDTQAFSEARLPPGWSGQGVLVRQSGSVPRSAPPWAHITAEVLNRDGDRVLRTCGRAGRIKNPALARTTAESRARAELGRWLQSHEVEGSRPIDSWTEPGTGLTFTLLEVVVPEEWIPGRPLPE